MCVRVRVRVRADVRACVRGVTSGSEPVPLRHPQRRLRSARALLALRSRLVRSKDFSSRPSRLRRTVAKRRTQPSASGDEWTETGRAAADGIRRGCEKNALFPRAAPAGRPDGRPGEASGGRSVPMASLTCGIERTANTDEQTDPEPGSMEEASTLGKGGRGGATPDWPAAEQDPGTSSRAPVPGRAGRAGTGQWGRRRRGIL